MTKRTIVLENMWVDESDEFWDDEEEVANLILLALEGINWEIKKEDVHVLAKGNSWMQY
jgi:hypothetical protein